MATTEFGRTMKQYGLPVDQTGTNHNPLNNSVLIGGKGICGGQVIGESDCRCATETVSKPHAAFDPQKLKLMGKAFDFSTGLTLAKPPEEYSAAAYLGVNSVVNTVYKLFGASTSKYRKLERNSKMDAPQVPGLLKT
jgi:hypothetical protein